MEDLFYWYFFSSCQEIATLYLPTSLSHHIINEKGDNRIGAAIKVSDTGITTGEFQAAYMPLNKLVVLANFSYANKSIDDFEKRKLLFGEIGIGTHATKNLSEKIASVFELSGGYGIGDATDFRQNSFNDGSSGTIIVEDRFYAKSRRFYGQLNWGFRYKNSSSKFQFQFGPALRFAIINIYKVNHISNQRMLELSSPRFKTLDFGHNFSIGINNFHFYTQILLTSSLGGSSSTFFDEYVDANNGHVSGVLGVKMGF